MTLPNAKRTAVAGLVTAVLGLQLFAILPPERGLRYWPFTSYPMYSNVYRAGATFTLREARGHACADSTRVITLTPELLHYQWQNLRVLLGRVVRTPPTDVTLLEQLARRFAPEPVCSLEVWGKTYTIGGDGLESRDVPWTLLRKWSVTP